MNSTQPSMMLEKQKQPENYDDEFRNKLNIEIDDYDM